MSPVALDASCSVTFGAHKPGPGYPMSPSLPTNFSQLLVPVPQCKLLQLWPQLRAQLLEEITAYAALKMQQLKCHLYHHLRQTLKIQLFAQLCSLKRERLPLVLLLVICVMQLTSGAATEGPKILEV